MVTPVQVTQVVLVAASAVLFALAVRTYRRRGKPIETSFAALLSLLGATALCLGITTATGWFGKLIWLHTNLLIPVALISFSLDYYGSTVLESRTRLAALLTPVALGSLGGSVLIVGTSGAVVGETAPIAALAEFPTYVYDLATTFDRVGYYYTAALIVVALGLVFRNVVRYEHLDTRLGVLIAFVGVWPWFGNFVLPELAVFHSPVAGLAALSTGYSASVLLSLVVVGPLDVFESSPAAGNVGPETVLDSMDAAVFMVDDHDQLLRLNAVALATFDVRESDVVGRPLEDVLGESVAGLENGEIVPAETVDGVRQFEVTRSPVTDRWGEERGMVVMLQDVTQKLTREQRLEVLNRVLRHNIRNNASSIIARAELISNDIQEPDDGSAEQIIDTTQKMMETAESAREIEEMMTASRERATASIEDVVDRVRAQLGDEYPAVEVTTAVPDDATAAVSPTVLEIVLHNVMENGAEHNDADQPILVVSSDYTGDSSIEIAVSDNGPGIPEYEQSVLDAGAEDQLQHGSGLGLWAAHWGVTQMGGSLSISDNEPRGSTVTLRLPTATESPEPEPVRAAAD